MLKLGFIPTKPSLPFVPRYLPSLSFQPRCFHLHVHVLSCLGSSIPLFLPCIAIFTLFLPSTYRFLHTSPLFSSQILSSPAYVVSSSLQSIFHLKPFSTSLALVHTSFCHALPSLCVCLLSLCPPSFCPKVPYHLPSFCPNHHPSFCC